MCVCVENIQFSNFQYLDFACQTIRLHLYLSHKQKGANLIGLSVNCREFRLHRSLLAKAPILNRLRFPLSL